MAGVVNRLGYGTVGAIANFLERLWIQPVDATHWLNRFAGVSKSNVFRGRSFNALAMLLSFA